MPTSGPFTRSKTPSRKSRTDTHPPATTSPKTDSPSSENASRRRIQHERVAQVQRINNQVRTTPSPSVASPPSASAPRRSNRVPSITEKAQQYLATSLGSSYGASCRSPFPLYCDTIAVKWIVSEEEIWWPATVTEIDDYSSAAATRTGEVRYHAFQNYNAEYAKVTFYYIHSTNERFISSEGKNNLNNLAENADAQVSMCSWMFPDEVATHIPEISHRTSTIQATAPRTPNRSPDKTLSVKRPSTTRRQGSENSLHRRRLHSAIRKRDYVDQPGPFSPQSSQSNPDQTHTSALENNMQHAPGDSSASECPRDDDSVMEPGEQRALKGSGNDVQLEEKSTAIALNVTNERETQRFDRESHIQMRLELLERKMRDVSQSHMSDPSSAAQSVIISLKWAILRQLEKPLKEIKHPKLCQLGVADCSTEVSAQCDYFTFRELVSCLAYTHGCKRNEESTGRLAFSPSFDTIQSGSVASDNLTVIFSTLADITRFLGIRDELDYESILVKEVVDESKTILRLMGTFQVEEVADTDSVGSTHHSISADSNFNRHNHKQIRIYVATAPSAVSIDTINDGDQNPNNSAPNTFNSIVIDQKCEHFNNTSYTFQSRWTSSPVHSPFKVSCAFDLDGIARPSQLKNFFTLSWSRQSAPSSKKWTKDIHSLGTNSPGSLRLSLPSVFISASKNVTALSAILDENIETFMNFRSSLYRSSTKN